MPTLLELPHTPGCVVCGPDNPLGLKMSLFVDPASGIVHVNFSPETRHIGFQGIVHGGMIGTIIDEAMVWAATWNQKRFCVCGEFTVRFRRPAQIDEPLHLEARVEFARPKLVQTMATIRTPAGSVVATGEGKYVPMTPEESQKVMRMFVDDEKTRAAAGILRGTPTSAAPAEEK
jgi:acyl-coenzyme A thioesterase PaaI-like protein